MFAKLNVFEQILLSQNFDSSQKGIAKAVFQKVAILPIDVKEFERCVSTALQSNGLDTGDDMGIRSAMLASEEAESESKLDMMLNLGA